MNLRFFTIEVERNADIERCRNARPHTAEARQQGRLPWIGLGLLVASSAIAAGWGGWLVAGGDPTRVELASWVAFLTSSGSAEADDQARLEVISQPGGATVTIDGQRRGSTPLELQVAHGSHTLVLMHPDAIDEQRQIWVADDMTINVSMWLRRPTAMLLKPAYPGASIADVAFLEDGRLGLSMASAIGSAGGGEHSFREPWIFDPTRGSLAEFTTLRPSLRTAKVAISPDGLHVAYPQLDESTSHVAGVSARLKEVWVADASASPVRVFALPSANAGSTSDSASSGDIEAVHDLTWTPDGNHLLITVRLAAIGGGYPSAPRSRLLLVDASPEQLTPPVELMTLPAEVVASSYTWAPDGNWVAFLTQASSRSGGSSFVALCALDTSAGGAMSGFRYLADLEATSNLASPLPVAPAAWSPMGNGRVVYAAATPKLSVSNPLGLPTTSGGEPGLFVATPVGQGLTAEEGQRLGSGTGLTAPAWASGSELDGAGVLALTRSDRGSKPLIIRGVDAVNGMPQNLDVVLPAAVGGSGVVAGRWDLAHGRLLVLARHDNSNSGLLDYWLVELQARAGAN